MAAAGEGSEVGGGSRAPGQGVDGAPNVAELLQRLTSQRRRVPWQISVMLRMRWWQRLSGCC
jgi:hypothetical protein